MGLFQKFRDGLQKTHAKLSHEIKRIVTLSPKLTGATLEELEAALLGADLGTAMTQEIIDAVKQAYETQGRSGLEVLRLRLNGQLPEAHAHVGEDSQQGHQSER